MQCHNVRQVDRIINLRPVKAKHKHTDTKDILKTKH
jgi:hypothetical protein